MKAVWKDGEAIIFPFSIADNDLAVVEVDIFDTEAHGFHDAESAAVHDLGNEFGCAGEAGYKAFDFIFGEDGGDGLCALGSICGKGCFVERDVEEVAVEEEDGTKGLILGGG